MIRVPAICRSARPARPARPARGEQGSALVLALLFLTVCGVAVGGLLTFANTGARATSALRASRGTDFDAEGAMQVAIAMVRTGSTACTTSAYVPATSLLNNPVVPVRIDCYPISSVATGTSAKRNDVFYACPSSAASPCDAQAYLRSNVIFYDWPGTGSSIGIQSWSSQ